MTNTLSIPNNVLTALATGNKESARQSLLKLVNVEPTHTLGWLYLAAALPRSQAILALRRVLVLEPGNQIALRNLKRLYGVRNPNFSLELKDINPEAAEKIEEENLAPFGNEYPTMNLTMVEAKFGEETPTLPGAFRHLITNSEVAQALDQLPGLSESLAELLGSDFLDLDLTELENLNNPEEVTSPPPSLVAKTPPEKIEKARPKATNPLPKLGGLAEMPPLTAVEAIYPPPAPPQPRPQPVIPAQPPLTWVNPRPGVAEKPAVPLGRLNTLKAARAQRSTAGAADSGLDDVETLRPRVPQNDRIYPARYAGPWLGFATSGIFAALIVIAVLFSLYWFLG